MPSAPASPPPSSRDPDDLRIPWIVSIVLHAGFVLGVVAMSRLAPDPPVTVPVFELVAAPEPPRLRPLTPKAPQPAEAPRERARPPEPPKPVPKPDVPAARKPEPKPSQPSASRDTALPVKPDAPQETSSQNPVQVSNAAANPQLALWAGRVKRLIESRWNPPPGIQVPGGQAKTVVRFRVSLDGQISAVEIAQASGNTLLDEEARRAVLRQDRLPKPMVPETFSEDFLQVSYEFIYKGL